MADKRRLEALVQRPATRGEWAARIAAQHEFAEAITGTVDCLKALGEMVEQMAERLERIETKLNAMTEQADEPEPIEAQHRAHRERATWPPQ